jgi:hypothetical protein
MRVKPTKKGRSTIIQTDMSPEEAREVTGTISPELVAVLISQASAAIWVPSADPERQAQWAAATFDAMRGIAPADPVEGMLAVQMVATHHAAMECFRRAHLAEQTFEGRQLGLKYGDRLVRSFAALTDALNRHRGKGQQVVRVEHVTVQAGGQAIVGTVTRGGGGDPAGSEDRPHAQAALGHAAEPPMRGPDAQREPVPITCGAGPETLPDARRRSRQRRPAR